MHDLAIRAASTRQSLHDLCKVPLHLERVTNRSIQPFADAVGDQTHSNDQVLEKYFFRTHFRCVFENRYFAVVLGPLCVRECISKGCKRIVLKKKKENGLPLQ
eukprot:m.60056 g.60056  ORF g.60056 m.60056 type:complete len:103 (+) comp22793_c0_seq2:618-926(+)